MMPPEDYPEIDVHMLAEKLRSGTHFFLLDVREYWELDLAKLDDSRLVVVPMSQMTGEREQVFPPELLCDLDADIVVLCHHGVRSMQVTRWMRSLGWRNVFSLAGGIDAYASQVDSQIGFY